MHGIIYLVNEPSQSKESLVLSYMGYDVRIIHRILVQFNFVCAYYYKINHIHDIVNNGIHYDSSRTARDDWYYYPDGHVVPSNAGHEEKR